MARFHIPSIVAILAALVLLSAQEVLGGGVGDRGNELLKDQDSIDGRPPTFGDRILPAFPPTFGRALRLDGDWDYMRVFDAPSLHVSGEITIEAWVSFTECHERNPLVTKWKTDLMGSWALQVIPDGRSVLGVSGDGVNSLGSEAIGTGSDIRYGAHHVAGVYDPDSSLLRIFIDGIQSGESNGPREDSIYVSNSLVLIGAVLYAADDAFFEGYIDEVRIWNRKRTLSQIQTTMRDTLSREYYASSDSGLVAYWRFDSLEDMNVGDSGNDDVRDLTPNGNHGDLVGDASLGYATDGSGLRSVAASPGHDVRDLDRWEYWIRYCDSIADGNPEESIALARKVLAVVEEQGLDRAALWIQNRLCLYRILLAGAVECGRPCTMLYESLLEHQEALLGKNHPDVAATLHNLAFFSPFGRAETYLTRAVTIRESLLGRNRLKLAQSLYGLGHLYSKRTLLSKAEPLLLRALAIMEQSVGDNHPYVATIANELGNVYWKARLFSQSEDMFRRALEIHEDGTIENDLNTALARNNLGAVLNQRGQFHEAESLLVQSLEILAADPNSPPRARGGVMMNLGTSLAFLGDLSRAEETLLSGIEVEKVYGSPMGIAPGLDVLGLINRRKGAAAVATGLHLRASIFARRRLLAISRTMNEDELIESAGFLRTSVDMCLSAYLDSRNTASHMTGSLLDVVLSTKGLAFDAAAVAVRRDVYSPKRDSLAGLRSILSRFSAGRAPRQSIDSLEQAINDLETQISRSGFSLTFVTAKEISSLLPRESVLIEFYKYDYIDLPDTEKADGLYKTSPWYVAGVISSAGTASLIDLGPAGVIDSVIKTYRAHLLGVAGAGDPAEADDRTYHRLGSKLYNLLWKPVASQIKPGTTVFVAPDGALNLVAFAALIDDQSHYLVESYAFHYLSSGRDLVRIRHGSRQGAGLLAVGDPDYDSPLNIRREFELEKAPLAIRSGRDAAMQSLRSGCGALNEMHVERLAQTRNEVAAVCELWQVKNGSKHLQRLLDAAASEENFKALASRFRILHLATHGFYLQGECSGTNLSELIPRLSFLNESPQLFSSDFIDLGEATDEEFSSVPDRRATISRFFQESPSDMAKVSPPGDQREDLEESRISESEDVTLHLNKSTGENPLLLSGLLLAGSNIHDVRNNWSDGEDGFLTALEVSTMDLRETGLVVLSACETGLGEVKDGEGVYGLRRAFQLAGAATVISSLWQVSDESTKRFMERLYFHEEDEYPELLRRVAVEKLKELRIRKRPTHPFSWGAFVATGDWRR